MSSEKQGWLSAVSRLFSSGQETSTGNHQSSVDAQRTININDLNNTHKSTSFMNGSHIDCTQSRSIRYLSPSIFETGSSQPGVSRTTFERFSVTSTTTSRKRVLSQDDYQANAVDVPLRRDSAKRSRREQLASSMLEEVVGDSSPRLISGHFDSSRMSRTMGDHLSYVDLHSPASNRSLIERISSNRSNASSLSSKTKAILSHLEKISTPAREARKMPVMRGSILSSERWAAMNTGPAAPPLLRTSATVPSRIQLLSTSIASQRRPYWRDITRKAHEKERNASPMQSNDRIENDTQVHPLFDMGSVNTHSMDLKMSSKLSQKNVAFASASDKCGQSDKGINHSEASVNVFNANELVDGEIDLLTSNTQSNATAATSLNIAFPSDDTRDDMIFTFDAPVERQLGQFVDEDDLTLLERDDHRNISSGVSSNSSDSDEDEHSSASDVEEMTVPTDQKTSRPPTAADSETSAEISSTVTPISSKDASPQTKVETSWNCPECSVTNKDVSTCTSCGYKYVDVTISKTRDTTVSSVNSNSDAGVGLSEGIRTSSQLCPDNADPKPANSFPIPTSSNLPASSDVHKVVEASESKSDVVDVERKAWECPDCMVQNKAIDSACVCCGHVMYKTSGAQSSLNVFGKRGFTSEKSIPKFSFGFGGTDTASSSNGTIKFGFGTSNVSATTSSKVSDKPEFESKDSKTVTSIDSEKEVDPKLSSSGFGSATFNSNFQNPVFSLSSGGPIFGSNPKPPLFGSSSTFLFKASDSFRGTTASTTATTASTTSSEVSLQNIPTNATTPFAFGTTPVTTTSGQQLGLFNSKKEENSTNVTSTFGCGMISGESKSNDPNAPSSSGVSVPIAEATCSVPSTSANVFGITGAGKSVFPTFGISSDSSQPFLKTTSSASNTKLSPFEMNVSTSSEAVKPFFSTSGTASVTKPLFGASAAITTPNSTVGLNFNFGSTNTFGGFTSIAPSTAVTFSLPLTTSSAPMCGSAVNTDVPKAFQFSTTIPEPTFQFGQAPLSGTTPFQFGSSQIAAPTAQALQAPGISASAVPRSNFSFTSSGSRKVVAARRRLPQRKQ